MIEDVRKFRADIIYLRCGVYLFPVHTLLALAPAVLELNSNDVAERALRGWYARLFNLLTRGLVLRNAAALVAVTREIVELPANQRYGKPSRVIGNGIDLEQYDPLPPPSHTIPALTLVGSAGMAWHGVDKLVRLAEMYADLKINIVGYRPREVGRFLPANVKAYGFLDPLGVKDVLRETDVACGSLALHRNNMQEGSTLKVPEALAYGIPVLLGYHDTDLAGLKTECILQLPNTEDNVAANAEQIRSFAYRMRGRRIRREDISARIDQRAKEQDRLAFFDEIVRNSRHGSR
jgi:glycosyltransferase involved in cell wall biosynthesis